MARPYIKLITMTADGRRAETTAKGPTVTALMLEMAHVLEHTLCYGSPPKLPKKRREAKTK